MTLTFDLEKMIGLYENDRLIQFMVDDLTRRNFNMTKDEILYIVFVSEVEGNSDFLEAYENEKGK